MESKHTEAARPKGGVIKQPLVLLVSVDIIKDTPLLDNFVDFEGGASLFYFICIGSP